MQDEEKSISFTRPALKQLAPGDRWESFTDEQERWTQSDKGTKLWHRYGWKYMMLPDGQIIKGKTWQAIALEAGYL